MFVISVTVLKKLRKGAAAPVTEEAHLMIKITANHVCEMIQCASFEFHRAQPPLFPNIA